MSSKYRTSRTKSSPLPVMQNTINLYSETAYLPINHFYHHLEANKCKKLVSYRLIQADITIIAKGVKMSNTFEKMKRTKHVFILKMTKYQNQETTK